MARIATLIIVAVLGSMTDRVAWGSEVPSGYVCHFADGGAWTFEGGKYLQEKASALDLKILHDKKNRETATLKTQEGSASLKRVAALDANHYLEVTVGGYLNITTIFDKISDKDGYPAVHSRHLGILGRPIVSQYRGICRAAN